MAKLTFSPLIAGASGKAADAVFANWKGRPYVRQRVTPANPKTAAQLAIRDSMTEAVALWNQLSSTLKNAFALGAVPKQYSGYNDWVALNRKLIQDASGLRMPRRDLADTGAYINIPVDFAYDTEPDPGHARFTWTDTGEEISIAGIIYDSTDDTLFDENLAYATMAAETLTITDLIIAHVYLFGFAAIRVADSQMVHCASLAHTQVT